MVNIGFNRTNETTTTVQGIALHNKMVNAYWWNECGGRKAVLGDWGNWVAFSSGGIR